ncbi:helicase-related protein [Cellulosilyticum sp. ST5]|uniref:helicase-related protein n=1 Tax=Cellulosilyticum sp. ST5 TaxID=3055805 RepID=UPI003977BC45
MDYTKYYEAREHLIEILKKDLIGPIEETEIIRERPSKYYSAGILFPRGMKVGGEEEKKDELSDSKESDDNIITICNTSVPSAYGMTFTLKPEIEKIKIYVEAATYTRVSEKEIVTQSWTEDRWHRSSCVITPLVKPTINGKYTIENTNLVVNVTLRKTYDDGSRTITVSLVNSNEAQDSAIDNEELSYFQVGLKVCAENDIDSIFTQRKNTVDISTDNEMRKLEMLYRHIENIAIGHGCSVDWKEDKYGISSVSLSFIPEAEYLQMKPASEIKEELLDMDALSKISKGELRKYLLVLVDSYQKWIMDRSVEVNKLEKRYQDVAQENMKCCVETLNRIKQGIDLITLNKDDDIFRAFQLANKAMYNQRYYQLKQKGISEDKINISWYPFQLAFILQNLGSIVDEQDAYREVVDLLWFPTGGGKTEAYLGVVAFTIFYRRITKGDIGAGTTVIMRYTLRLLTLQQFERAAALICACEELRRQNNLGNHEISIGLWVGSAFTPNSVEEAQKNLEEVKEQTIYAQDIVTHIRRCPHCGAEIRPEDDYQIRNGGLSIKCSNKECIFSDKLPLYIVDEDIYKQKPTLIIATADKFARMAWEPKIYNLFGEDGKYLPPELIVQDELHLFSGPLGTISGIYELAIRYLCTRTKYPPKIIAATATVRNASEQILGLYGTKHRQFPPQGLDIRDSYFAKESTPDDKPARKYVGVLCPGLSGTTMLIRTYAALLFASRHLVELGYQGKVIDTFWTLTGYFNSLRELGSTNVTIVDDIQDRYKFLVGEKFKQCQNPIISKCKYDYFEELTSRKSSKEISATLQELENKYPNENPFDYILASNMISVGVDVGRLSHMIVNGQPKTNSEYIQATSRVGRNTPGLVCTMYSPWKSRDRSHYENFLYYHKTIYKYVEATSVTPFSLPAREKALHAAFVSIVRLSIASMRGNDAARNFSSQHNKVQEIYKYILDYIQRVDAEEYVEAKTELDDFIDKWEKNAGEKALVYDGSKADVQGLLTKAEDSAPSYGIDVAMPTLNSVRTVDNVCGMYMEVRG